MLEIQRLLPSFRHTREKTELPTLMKDIPTSRIMPYGMTYHSKFWSFLLDRTTQTSISKF